MNKMHVTIYKYNEFNRFTYLNAIISKQNILHYMEQTLRYTINELSWHTIICYTPVYDQPARPQ